MQEEDAIQTMSLEFVIPQKYIMPIFTCTVPVQTARHIFDLFIWEKSGHLCLLRIVSKCLKHCEQRCLQMEDPDQMFKYISKGQFIKDAIEEKPLFELFMDESTYSV